MNGNVIAGFDRLTQLICCELCRFLRKAPAKIFLVEGDAWKMLAELTVHVVRIRPVKGAGHIHKSVETGLRKPDVDVQAHKALDLLVIPEELVSEFGRKILGAVKGRASARRAAKVKTYAVVGLNDRLSWIFHTLLLLRWPFHACDLLVRCRLS